MKKKRADQGHHWCDTTSCGKKHHRSIFRQVVRQGKFPFRWGHFKHITWFEHLVEVGGHPAIMYQFDGNSEVRIFRDRADRVGFPDFFATDHRPAVEILTGREGKFRFQFCRYVQPDGHTFRGLLADTRYAKWMVTAHGSKCRKYERLFVWVS